MVNFFLVRIFLKGLSVSIFNVARYLTDSLRGPVLAHYDEAEGRVERVQRNRERVQRNREGVQRKERVQRKELKRACAAQRSCAAQLIVCSAIGLI